MIITEAAIRSHLDSSAMTAILSKGGKNMTSQSRKSRCRSLADDYASIGGNITLTKTVCELVSTNLKRHVPESEPMVVESMTK